MKHAVKPSDKEAPAGNRALLSVCPLGGIVENMQHGRPCSSTCAYCDIQPHVGDIFQAARRDVENFSAYGFNLGGLWNISATKQLGGFITY
jgi:hypothetical protein